MCRRPESQPWPPCARWSRRATSKLLGTALVRGRYFDDRDTDESTRAVVIDESLARRFWRDEDPIGRRVFRPSNAKELESAGPDTPWLTVVGVVRDAQLRGPLVTDWHKRNALLAVCGQRAARLRLRRSVRPAIPTALVREIRSALAQIDREIPLFDIRTMSERAELALMLADQHDAPGNAVCRGRRVSVGDRPVRGARVSGRHSARARSASGWRSAVRRVRSSRSCCAKGWAWRSAAWCLA